MHYLFVESIAVTPHLETSAEIALTLKSQGHDVSFAWVGEDLPWSDFNLPFYYKFFGLSLSFRLTWLKKIFKKNNIDYCVIKDVDSHQREYIFKWSDDFQGNIGKLKSYNYKRYNLGMGAASSLISLYKDSQLNTLNNKKKVKLALTSSAIVFERSLAIIKALAPDFVVTFNGRFCTSKPIVLAAESLKIKVLRHERGSTFLKYELYSNSIHDFSYIKRRIIDSWKNAPLKYRTIIAKNFFSRKKAGDSIGWYSYTKYQTHGFAPQKKQGFKRVVYFSSSDDEFAAISESDNQGVWLNQINAVKNLIKAVSMIPNTELIIRLHPNLKNKSLNERSRWLNLPKKCVIIDAKNKIDSYALLDSADIVVTFGSTIGMESVFINKPTILMGPAAYSGTNSVIEPKNYNDLFGALKDNLMFPKSNLKKIFCYKYAYYYMTYGIDYKYYKPISLGSGFFLEVNYGYWPNLIFFTRRILRYLKSNI